MEVVNMYKCGICGHVFETEFEATRCEEAHLEFESAELVWTPIDCKKLCPKTIKVKFKNYPTPITYKVSN